MHSTHTLQSKTKRISFALFLTRRQLLTRRAGIVGALLAIASTAIALLLAYGASNTDVAGADAAIDSPHSQLPRPLSVITQVVSKAGPEFLSREFTGIVSARRTTRLAAKALGRVEFLAVDVGDAVKSGQALVQLDAEELSAERAVVAANVKAAQALLDERRRGPRRQDIEQAESRVRELQSRVELQRANFKRTEELRNTAAISKQEYDESKFTNAAVESQLDAAKQALELLQEGTREEQIAAADASVDSLRSQLKILDVQLADRAVFAPFDGQVQTRFVDEGAIVSAGQPLLEIVENGSLEIHVGLPPELAAGLTDDSLTVMLGKQTISTRLARISPSIEPATRTREVVLDVVPMTYHSLAVGSAVSVRLQTRVDSQGYWVPSSSLTTGARGLWAVFVAVPTQAETGSQAANEPQTAELQTAELQTAEQATVLVREQAAGPISEQRNGQPIEETLHPGTHRIERRQVELLRTQGDWSEIRGPIDEAERLVVAGVHRIVPNQLVLVSPGE